MASSSDTAVASVALAITATDDARQPEAQQLAQHLGVPFVSRIDSHYGFYLVFTESRLELRAMGAKAPGPVYVDFVGGAVAHRHKFGGGRGQPLARAVGLKHGASPTVLDATAGLGRDAFVLASLGCAVRMVERSPVIAALLADGLRLAEQEAELAPVIARMTLIEADARQYMTDLSDADRPDVVYLDPMYPGRVKSALVKKEMRYFRAIVGEDLDAPGLLDAALRCARRRVVVKRPRHGEALQGPKPTATIEGKTTRFDIYSVL